MRDALLAVTAATAFLAGCGQPAEDQARNTAVAKSGQVLPITDDMAAAATLPPATREEALKLMHERHEGMEKIGKAMKGLGREMEASTPDLDTVRSSAATIAGLAPKVSSWFPTGTGPDVGKTHAKPAIWEKPEDFAAKARAFQDAARKFEATARAGDMAAIKAGFGDLRKSCKSCHDLYRAEKH